MPEIKTKTTYLVDGKEFKTLDQIKVHAENSIGAIIDQMEPRLPPKQALALLELIVVNKKRLVELLTIEMDHSEDVLYSDLRNILDW